VQAYAKLRTGSPYGAHAARPVRVSWTARATSIRAGCLFLLVRHRRCPHSTFQCALAKSCRAYRERTSGCVVRTRKGQLKSRPTRVVVVSLTLELSCKRIKLKASEASFQRSVVSFSVRYTAGRDRQSVSSGERADSFGVPVFAIVARLRGPFMLDFNCAHWIRIC
jgi:hypothetical protein